jgi:hypothetical protein
MRALAPEVQKAMSMNSKKSIGGTSILIVLGLVALFVGVKWLVVLVPVAMMVWYGLDPALRSGRN